MDAKYLRDGKHYVPEALRRVCDDIRERLAGATREPGPTGEAAKRLRDLLLTHLSGLEERAFPAFAVLQTLVSSEARPERAELLPAIDRFIVWHDGLVKEHRSIVSSIEALWEAAYEEGNGKIAAFAQSLIRNTTKRAVVRKLWFAHSPRSISHRPPLLTRMRLLTGMQEHGQRLH